MKIFTLLISLTISTSFINPPLISADERIWLKDATIDGKPVKLCFDSGSNINALSQQAVKRLGLGLNTISTNNLPPGFVGGVTDQCTLSLSGVQAQTAFMVVHFPEYMNNDIDGIIGWFPSQNVVRIDAAAQEVDFFSKMPRRAVNWIQFSVLTNFGILELEIPHNDHANGVISIDTGSDRGMDLPSSEWRRWKETHPRSPVTMKTFYTPADGFVVREEAWADRINIGPLVLTGVPIIEEMPSAAMRWGDKNDGTLGLAALSRVELIVDGKNSVAYLQPKTTNPTSYPHNRLGAVFVPTTTHTNKAVAFVATGSPAYEAGIRNGDILLQVDEIPVIGWSANWIDRFALPAGTKLHLTLQRDGTNFETTAVLRQIIPPNDSNAK